VVRGVSEFAFSGGEREDGSGVALLDRVLSEGDDRPVGVPEPNRVDLDRRLLAERLALEHSELRPVLEGVHRVVLTARDVDGHVRRGVPLVAGLTVAFELLFAYLVAPEDARTTGGEREERDQRERQQQSSIHRRVRE
jgi:hypothetical protein